MQIYHSMMEYDAGPCCLALGTFDGVHLGHQALLKRAAALAREQGLVPAAMTFDRHPLALLKPEIAPQALTTPEEKRRLMAACGIQALVEEPFTRQRAAMEPEDFAAECARRMEARALVVGYNYTFGRGGRGNPELLTACGDALGFTVVVVPPVTLDGEPISSTRIRALLARGDKRGAARLLGHEGGRQA